MKSLVVFDCYQTLIYKKNLEKIVQYFSARVLKKKISLKHIQHAYAVLYDRHKFKHPRFTTDGQRQKFYLAYNQELFAVLGLSISSRAAAELHNQLRVAQWAAYPDTKSALRHLKAKKIPLGLLANWTSSLTRAIASAGLAGYFDFTYSSHDLKIDKPNPKIFTKLLNNARKKFDKIYYVGNDYELDIVSARAAGLIPILIDRAGLYPGSIDCLRVDDLKKLQTIIT